MRFKSRQFSKSFIQRIIVFLVLLIILNGTGAADDNFNELRKGVAYPGEIPNFDNFDAPTIVPGNTGKLKFTITNRYKFNSDNNMTNVSLLLEIYRYVTLEESKNVSKISNGPKIVGGNDALREIRDQFTAEFYWPLLSPNQTVPVELSVKSSGESPEGTFFIRMHINFIFNNTYFEMRSRGHFTDKQWEDAQPTATEQDGYYEDNLTAGRLKLNELGVDGVIPDTSIRIKNPIPIWPFYLGDAVLAM